MKNISAGRIFAAITLAALLSGGCNPIASEPGDLLMPLKVGNMWIGVETTYAPSGATTIDDTLEIIATKVIDGETWYVASNGRYLTNRSDGLYIRESSANACGGCGCTSFKGKYPARAGDSIITSTATVLLPDSDEPVEMITVDRVVTADTVVQTAAGSFNVHHYRTEVAYPANARFVTPESRFFKPNVGPVRIERGGDSVVWRWDLVKAVLR